MGRAGKGKVREVAGKQRPRQTYSEPGADAEGGARAIVYKKGGVVRAKTRADSASAREEDVLTRENGPSGAGFKTFRDGQPQSQFVNVVPVICGLGVPGGTNGGMIQCN